MDFVAQILAFVEELLAYLGEFDAAGIIDIIENFFASFAEPAFYGLLPQSALQ